MVYFDHAKVPHGVDVLAGVVDVERPYGEWDEVVLILWGYVVEEEFVGEVPFCAVERSNFDSSTHFER